MTQPAMTGAEPPELTGAGPRTTAHGSPTGPSATTRHLLGLQEVAQRSLLRTTVDATLQRVGGPVGSACAAAPTVAFVVAEAVAGLTPALIALLVTAVVACSVRLVRRESPGSAVTGLVVAAVCAAIAAVTGQARTSSSRRWWCRCCSSSPTPDPCSRGAR